MRNSFCYNLYKQLPFLFLRTAMPTKVKVLEFKTYGRKHLAIKPVLKSNYPIRPKQQTAT